MNFLRVHAKLPNYTYQRVASPSFATRNESVLSGSGKQETLDRSSKQIQNERYMSDQIFTRQLANDQSVEKSGESSNFIFVICLILQG